MEIRRIDDQFAVSPQITPADVEKIADEGFTTIICNRPDSEEAGQPTSVAIAKAAKQAGLDFHLIAVSGGAFPETAVARFRGVRQAAEGPVLAYCRTGTRSMTLETLANPEDRSIEDRLSRAEGAGYDLSSLRERLVYEDN
ncbi:TIGR01244 family sulfur transferase [Croceicoccus gelatinilyticus]|uniref:TIGR01244 family sulfur transferase n=1 Tax=Croceicoccus gelatinilyticus TaxID=2835536 RepID=UPI001BCABDB4|nr:TIGR01244 family sulfur transferase [Croceicoccus gelatinilyticus]MBS7670856.1 TIGR01244 family phosphatase [Croceicoccus gelatinilyticus]